MSVLTSLLSYPALEALSSLLSFFSSSDSDDSPNGAGALGCGARLCLALFDGAARIDSGSGISLGISTKGFFPMLR